MTCRFHRPDAVPHRRDFIGPIITWSAVASRKSAPLFAYHSIEFGRAFGGCCVCCRSTVTRHVPRSRRRSVLDETRGGCACFLFYFSPLPLFCLLLLSLRSCCCCLDNQSRRLVFCLTAFIREIRAAGSPMAPARAVTVSRFFLFLFFCCFFGFFLLQWGQ